LNLYIILIYLIEMFARKTVLHIVDVISGNEIYVDEEVRTLNKYPENIFYRDGSMIDDVAGFAVHNKNYETGHQLAKPSSVFSAEISVMRMALEHIQICPRGRHLSLSNSLSSLKDYM
jgi:hypothetical protein